MSVNLSAVFDLPLFHCPQIQPAYKCRAVGLSLHLLQFALDDTWCKANYEVRFIREKMTDMSSEVLLRLLMEPKAKVYWP
jgi:hypothetical protein